MSSTDFSLSGSRTLPAKNRSFPAGLLLLLTALLLFPVSLSAQAYDGRACKDGNEQIKNLLKKGRLDNLVLNHGITGDADRWATSFLRAEGKPPTRMPDYDVELEGDADIHDWTCMFAAFRATDRNEETAWSEGVPGPGIGEVLIVPVEDSRGIIRIRPGFALSQKLFLANNRPRRIRIYALQPLRRDATQIGIIYTGWKVIVKKEFELADANRWQTVQLPAHKIEDMGGFLAIEILSVYPGSKYNDTLISEVMSHSP